MTAVVFLIEQVAPGLYLLLAAGIFIVFRRWAQARTEFRSTQFELEREIFRYRQANARTLLILLLEAVLVVIGIQQVVAPTLREASGGGGNLGQVITDLPFFTPTPAPVAFGSSPIDASGVNLGQEEVARVLATPVPTPTPVGTLLPNPPPTEGCDSPGATLQVPANGLLVFSPIQVIGTAFTENFAFYRFELKGPATLNNFAILRDYDRPVTSIGPLGQFVPGFYVPGNYQFRLTVFDITTTLKEACTVNITISEPIPTPTPLQQS